MNQNNSQPPAQGRLDVLAIRVIERAFSMWGNPVATALYQEYRQELDGVIEKQLAPRDSRGRIIKQQQGKTAVRPRQQRQAGTPVSGRTRKAKTAAKAAGRYDGGPAAA